MTVESQPVISPAAAIHRRVQPPRSMIGQTAVCGPRAKNASCGLREACFLHPQPSTPCASRRFAAARFLGHAPANNDNPKKKVCRRHPNPRPMLRLARRDMIYSRGTKLLPTEYDRQCTHQPVHPDASSPIVCEVIEEACQWSGPGFDGRGTALQSFRRSIFVSRLASV